MFEFIIEIIGEFLLQVVVESLVELGFHAVTEPFRRAPNPWLAGFGYTLFGLIAGGISLWVFPMHLAGKGLRLANLLLTPIAVGLLMNAMGAWRARNNQAVLRIDRFAWGYLFALSFALIRYWFAQ
jgi:hypothetical protein